MTPEASHIRVTNGRARFYNIRALENAQKWRSWMRWGSWVERKEPEGSALHPGHENSPKKKNLLQFNSASIVSMKLSG